VRSTVGSAYRALWFSPLRTVLSIGAIGVGAATVVVMVGVGRGAEQEVARQIEKLGTNLVLVSPARLSRTAGRARQTGTAATLRPRDERFLREGCPHAVEVVPTQSRQQALKFGNQANSAMVVGTTDRMTAVRDLVVERGRFFTAAEERGAMRVAVIGPTVVRKMFGERVEPVGATLRIGSVPFTVLGVLEARGSSLSGEDEDNQIFVPLRTALSRLFRIDYLDGFILEARSEADVEKLADEAIAALALAHRLEPPAAPDFEVQSQADLVSARREVAQRFALLVVSVGSLALLVGSLGVLSVMLLGIRERTAEIGLRRALGATRRDVALQFLVESALLGLLGAAVGLVLSVVASTVAADAMGVPFAFAPDALGLASGVCIVIGLLAGVAPAGRAARLEPVEALRK
jgi:putative ABC transport system permease protein